ncbi:MAG: serine/threonine protein kinase, partial [Planctomycetes bacterium]|nr:serine/threonine protein kinase [Planctomycetota bacterium]
MADAAENRIGTVLGGCRLERIIGRGGMGVVFEGHHVALDKKVAVKILPPEMAARAEFLKRFLREAQSAARLEHPHIVQVMNVGGEGGDHFIVMQLVEGESLAQRVEREGPLPPPEACRLLLQCASALGFAHAKGIVHRDVKPDNILLTPERDARMTDFGLAGRIDQRSSISTPDSILGTPYFISPEQCRGEAADARSDVYSLGAAFYYVLTATFPFQGDTAMATLLKHLNEPLIPPRLVAEGIPRELSDLVERMM